MRRFHLSLIRPVGFVHSDCFFEVIEALYAGLTKLGHKVTGGENTIEPDAVNIVLGAHLLEEDVVMALPVSTVIYNLEQPGAWWLPPWYAHIAERFQIWDYSRANIPMWKAMRAVHPPRIVEVGYMPELRRIPVAAVQDIDILFYGSINDRRLEILKQIEAAGLRVECCFGVYGAARDAMIARSKLVLNLHSEPEALFEVVRVSYLLANSKAVVSEGSPDIGYLAQAVALAHRDDMARTCRELLEDDAKRHRLELRGYRMFSANSLLHSLSEAVREERPAGTSDRT